MTKSGGKKRTEITSKDSAISGRAKKPRSTKPKSRSSSSKSASRKSTSSRKSSSTSSKSGKKKGKGAATEPTKGGKTQSSLKNLFVKDNGALYIQKCVLLTDEIYGNRVPMGMEGMLFVYEVIAYNSDSKDFTLKYRDLMAEEDGDRWITQDGEREVMNGVKLDSVKEGHKLYNETLGRVNAREYEERQVAKKILDKNSKGGKDGDKISFSDLDKAADEAELGWQSSDVLNVMFQLTGETASTSNNKKKRQWKHKDSGLKFWQFTSKSGKTWDTGIFNTKLKVIANGNSSAKGNKKAIARGKYLLERRMVTCKTPQPSKGDGFYPFEEDLFHHINEALVIISTGSSCSFFNNAYVRDLLTGLNERHRPVYPQKLARLLRVVGDVQQEEVCAFCLLYEQVADLSHQ